jgi:hypothetical protein
MEVPLVQVLVRFKTGHSCCSCCGQEGRELSRMWWECSGSAEGVQWECSESVVECSAMQWSGLE